MKARLDSSRCMFLPQFCASAWASYIGVSWRQAGCEQAPAYLEGVKLDICVAMREAPDDALDGLLRAVLVARDLVADLDNSAPVLRGEAFVSRLDCPGVSIWAKKRCLARRLCMTKLETRSG